MNRGQYSTQSSNNLLYQEYLQIAKLYSKDKSPNHRRHSKSPKQSDAQVQKKSQNEQYRQLQQRYRGLQNNYRDLLQKARQRGIEHQKLKTQIKVYQKNHQRDKQEIQRLRCILGLIKKRSVSIQVEQDQLDSSNAGRASRLNKFDQSTEDEIKLKNSAEKIKVKDRISPQKNIMNRKQEEGFDWQKLNKNASQGGLYLKSKIKYHLNNTNLPAKHQRQLKESHSRLSNSPYSKLRYIPGTSFK